RDPQPSWEYPPLSDQGYADRDLYEYWSARDPIRVYAAKLEAGGIINAGDLERFKRDAEALVDQQARAVIDAPWPEPAQAGAGVFVNEAPRVHIEVLDPTVRLEGEAAASAASSDVEDAPPFDAKGRTFLEAVMLGIGDALRGDP